MHASNQESIVCIITVLLQIVTTRDIHKIRLLFKDVYICLEKDSHTHTHTHTHIHTHTRTQGQKYSRQKFNDI